MLIWTNVAGTQFSFLRTALTPFRMPDLDSSGMPVVCCTGMLKDQFSGRLIELKCEMSKSQPNLNTYSSQFDLIHPPPNPQEALLKIFDINHRQLILAIFGYYPRQPV